MRSSGPILIAVACLAVAGCGGRPQPVATNAPTTASGARSAPAAATLASPKIAPVLAAVARKLNAMPAGAPATSLSGRVVRVNAAREIQVYIRVRQLSSELQQALENAGANGVRPSPALGVYQAWATPTALAKIAALPEVTKIMPPTYGFPRLRSH